MAGAGLFIKSPRSGPCRISPDRAGDESPSLPPLLQEFFQGSAGMLPAVGGIPPPTLVSSAWTASPVGRPLRGTMAKQWRQSRLKFGIARGVPDPPLPR